MSRACVSISLDTIYEEMKMNRIQDDKRHAEIIKRLDYTNGKVKLNRWIATTAMAMAMLLIGIMMR